MKKCLRCDIEKPISEFYLRKGKRPYAYCKPCNLAESIERQRRLKTQCVNYKGGKCVKCDYSKCFAALDFHHLDPTQKDFSISQNKGTKFTQRIRDELDKCILVCCRCHREIHDDIKRQKDWFDKIRSLKDLKPKIKMNRNCISCGKSIGKSSTRCKSCVPRKFKITWPPIKELLQTLKESNYTQVAKKLGVSDNAIRRHLKYHA